MNKHHHNHNLPAVYNFIKVFLLAMNKYNLKNMAVFLQDYLNDTRNSMYCQ